MVACVVTVVKTLPVRTMTIVTPIGTVTYRLDKCQTRAYTYLMPTTGKALRSERRRYEITATDLAARMGLSRQTVWVIERSGAVDPIRVEQYRAALATLRDANEASQGEAA